MEIFTLTLVILLIASLIIPWVNLGKMSSLKQRIRALELESEIFRDRLKTLEGADKKTPEAQRASDPEHAETRQALVENPQTATATPPEPIAISEQIQKQKTPPPAPPRKQISKTPVITKQTEATNQSGGRSWFGKLTVWIGGIALLMSGLFMIKYSIESGMLTPSVRLMLSSLFATTLCLGGSWISLRSNNSNSMRVGRSLTGAGLSIYYFCVYAAVHLWQFIGQETGFILMVAVTLMAALLALKLGMAIALMGMMGGFLTPILIGSKDPNTVALLSYLALLYSGLLWLSVKKQWWPMAIASTCLAFLWSTGLYTLMHIGELSLNIRAVMLFTLVLCALNLLWFIRVQTDHKWAMRAQAIAWVFALVQGLYMMQEQSFSPFDMGLFCIITLTVLVLACLQPKRFHAGAWLSLGVCTVALLIYEPASSQELALWATGMGTALFLAGHWASQKPHQQRLWLYLPTTSLCTLGAVSYYLLEVPYQAWGVPFHALWLTLSLLGAGIILWSTHRLHKLSVNQGKRDIYAQCVLAAVGLIALGTLDYLIEHRMALMIAYALLYLASVLYWQRINLPKVEFLMLLAGGAWAMSAVTSITQTLETLTASLSVEDYLQLADSADSLIIAVTISGVAWFATSKLIKQAQLKKIILGVSATNMGILLIAGYVGAFEYLWGIRDESLLAFEVNLTVFMWMIAVTLSLLANKFKELTLPSLIIALVALLRWIGLDLIMENPWLTHKPIGDVFFFNLTLLQYGVPFIACALLAWSYREKEERTIVPLLSSCSLLAAFIWISTIVRDYFTKNTLSQELMSDGELYAYSVVWLITGVIYQSLGLWRKNRLLDTGALLILLLTVGKVFFVDAAELTGLWRVCSFLGLGIVLIAIGYFYNRFIFKDKTHAPQ